jgi:hypothetical protein
MTKDDAKIAAITLAYLERIGHARQAVTVKACGYDIRELVDEAAFSRIKAAIDAELTTAEELLRKQLAGLGVDA